MLTVDARGMVCDCNRQCETVFKRRRSEMLWKHISVLLPKLAEVPLWKDGTPNPRLLYMSRIGHRFQAISGGGNSFASGISISSIGNEGGPERLSIFVRPVTKA
jgi:hypothetical protein